MTTAVRLPLEWASNATYSSGPDTGLPTKQDPATESNGFIAGTAVAAQQMNYLLNQQTTAARRTLAIALCKPRQLPITLSVVSAIAVVSRGRGRPAVGGTAHSGGVPLIHDGDLAVGGVIASITAAVAGGAWNPTADRIVLVGGGGNRSCFSDDGGASWSAGGNLGGTGLGLTYNPTYSRFIAMYADHVRYSTNGAAWTDVTVTGVLGRGFARLTSGNTLVLTGGGPVALSVSTNGGTSWGAAGGTVPNAADISDRGSICGEGLDFAWHAGIRTSDGKVQISRTADGATWVQTAELSPINSLAFSPATIIKQCPDSGALFLFAGSAGGIGLYASLDGGDTWTEPLFANLVYGVNSISAAHGRLFLADSAGNLFASDGVGWL